MARPDPKRRRSLDEVGYPPEIRPRNNRVGPILIQRVLLAELRVHLGPNTLPRLDTLHKGFLLNGHIPRVKQPESGTSWGPSRGGRHTPTKPRTLGRAVYRARPGSGPHPPGADAHVHVHIHTTRPPNPNLEPPHGADEFTRGHRRRVWVTVDSTRGRVRVGQNSELVRRMSKKADPALAVGPILTRLSPVPSRVEPALEHAVSELTRVALPAASPAELRAGGARVVVLPGVPPASFFSWMGVWTLSPIMRSPTRALPHLELEHPEVIAREGVEWEVRLGVVRVVLGGGEVALEGGEVVVGLG